MYKVMLNDDKVIFHTNYEELKITDAKVELEINKVRLIWFWYIS